MMVISGGARRRMGGPQVPVPRLTCFFGIRKPGEQVEGENLALVGVAGKLEVKMAETLRINIRTVFEKNREGVQGLGKKDVCFLGLYRCFCAPAIQGVVIHSDKINPARAYNLLSDNGEAGLPGEIQGILQTGIELMIAGDGELAQSWGECGQQGGLFGEVVELPVHQIAGGHQDVRMSFLDFGKDALESPFPDNESQMHV